MVTCKEQLRTAEDHSSQYYPPTQSFLGNPFQNTSTLSSLDLKPADTCPATHLSHQAAASQVSLTLLTNLDGPIHRQLGPSMLNEASKIHLNHALLGKPSLPSPGSWRSPSPKV